MGGRGAVCEWGLTGWSLLLARSAGSCLYHTEVGGEKSWGLAIVDVLSCIAMAFYTMLLDAGYYKTRARYG